LNKIKLLYIEDDISTAEELIEIFGILNISNIHAQNYDEAVTIYETNDFDLIISDIELSSSKNGIDFIKRVRLEDKNIPIIITSGYTQTQYMLDSIELNIIRYLIKPISTDDLKSAIVKAFAILDNNLIVEFEHGFKYDSNNKYFTKNEKIIKVTNQEITLIEFLLANQGSVVSFEKLQYALAIDQEVSMDSLRTTIKKLRHNTYKEIIESISKVGYRIK